MEIQIDLHTLERAVERGTNESEIKDVIQTGLTQRDTAELVKPKFTISSKTVIINTMNRKKLKYITLLKGTRL
jgi:hypothetical protein